MIEIKKLCRQLQTIVEMDNSLGVDYCNLASGISGLDLSDVAQRITTVSGQKNAAVTVDRESNDTVSVVATSAFLKQQKPERAKPEQPLTPVSELSEVGLYGAAAKVAAISEINSKAAACQDCALSQLRKNAVRSEGGVSSKLAFVSSAPGREEDNSGRNFQGAAGQLIIDIIEKGIKISLEEVYFSSIVKCRPPGNRQLFEIEISACMQYFSEEMKVVAPQAIIAVGGAAANILTAESVSIEQMRGIWYEYNGIPVMPIYHPSFLLRQRRKLGRNNEYDRRTWQDIQQVISRLGLKR